jgi:hypothetical protein
MSYVCTERAACYLDLPGKDLTAGCACGCSDCLHLAMPIYCCSLNFGIHTEKLSAYTNQFPTTSTTAFSQLSIHHEVTVKMFNFPSHPFRCSSPVPAPGYKVPGSHQNHTQPRQAPGFRAQDEAQSEVKRFLSSCTSPFDAAHTHTAFCPCIPLSIILSPPAPLSPSAALCSLKTSFQPSRSLSGAPECSQAPQFVLALS